MAIAPSGPLELRGDINLEVNGNVTDTNVALHQLSIDAGFSTPDAMSDFYGYSSVVVPSVTTLAITQPTETTMCITGNVTNTGGENVSRGFYFGTNSTAAACNAKSTLSGTQGTGVFGETKSTAYCTTYNSWAFACNSAGETIGVRCQRTSPFPPYTPNWIPNGQDVIHSVASFSTAFANYGQNQNIQMGYVNPYSGGFVGMVNKFSGTVCRFTISNVYSCDDPNWTRHNHNAYGCNCSGAGYLAGQSYYCDFWGYTMQRCFTNSVLGCFSNPSGGLCLCSCGCDDSSAPPAIKFCTLQTFIHYWCTTPSVGPSTYSINGYGCSVWNNCNPPSDIRLKTNINYL